MQVLYKNDGRINRLSYFTDFTSFTDVEREEYYKAWKEQGGPISDCEADIPYCCPWEWAPVIETIRPLSIQEYARVMIGLFGYSMLEEWERTIAHEEDRERKKVLMEEFDNLVEVVDDAFFFTRDVGAEYSYFYKGE